MTFTPAQCRAARGLINMTQQHLADAAEISLRALANFEREATQPTRATLTVIRKALETKGVRFTETGGVEPQSHQ